MKRIILGLSLLLILVQNGFASFEDSYQQIIQKEKNKALKQSLKCEKVALFHSTTGDAKVCVKAINMIKKDSTQKKHLAEAYLNAGDLYNKSHGDKMKAYKYYIEAAEIGGRAGVTAQKNLNIMCKNNPWACK